MKSLLIALVALTSLNATAASLDISGIKKLVNETELKCKDGASVISSVNIQIGVAMFQMNLLKANAEEKGDLETAAKAEATIKELASMSDALDAEFNAVCIDANNAEKIFKKVSQN